MGSYMRIPLVPLYARSLGASVVQVGMINSSFLLMAGFFALPFGLFSDRIGRKLLVLCGLAICSSSSFLLYLSATPLQLLAVYLFFGCGMAAFAPALMSYVTDISPPSHLGRSYGWYTMALYWGMSLGPALGGFTAQWLSIRQVFLISGLFLFVVAWLVWLLLPRARHVIATGHRPRWGAESIRYAMTNRPLLACWLITMSGCFGQGMFVTFLPLHAQNQGIEAGLIGLIFAAQAFSNAVLRIPFGHLSDRARDRSTLVAVGSVGCAACVACLGFSTGVLGLVFCSAFFGIFMSASFTALGALICEVTPLQHRGLAMGGYNACIYFGMMFASALMGTVIEFIGFAGGFLVAASLSFLAACIFHLVLRNRPLVESSPNPKSDPICGEGAAGS